MQDDGNNNGDGDDDDGDDDGDDVLSIISCTPGLVPAVTQQTQDYLL